MLLGKYSEESLVVQEKERKREREWMGNETGSENLRINGQLGPQAESKDLVEGGLSSFVTDKKDIIMQGKEESK